MFKNLRNNLIDEKCPECGSMLKLDEVRGEIVCPECGLVEAENILTQDSILAKRDNINRVNNIKLIDSVLDSLKLINKGVI